MQGREKSLESLMELTGRGASRSRREVALLTLRNALALTEAGGAVFAVAGPRQLDKVALRRDNDTPESLPIQRSPGEFARTLQLAGLPRTVVDLAEAKGGADETCPGIEAGPAMFVPLRLREQEWGYLAVEPTRARVVVKEAGGEIRVQNALGGAVSSLAVTWGGQLYVVNGLRDGEEGVARVGVKPRLELSKAAAARFGKNVSSRLATTLRDGEFVAALEGQGFTPTAGLTVAHSDSAHLVRGEVER